jgi:hypothetical protein
LFGGYGGIGDIHLHVVDDAAHFSFQGTHTGTRDSRAGRDGRCGDDRVCGGEIGEDGKLIRRIIPPTAITILGNVQTRKHPSRHEVSPHRFLLLLQLTYQCQSFFILCMRLSGDILERRIPRSVHQAQIRLKPVNFLSLNPHVSIIHIPCVIYFKKDVTFLFFIKSDEINISRRMYRWV